MNMNIKTIAFLLCLISIASAFTLDGGGGVYWQNNYGRISVYPATLTDILNIQYMNITSNITETQNLDAAFEFNTSVIRPSKAYTWLSNVPHTVPAYVNVTEQVYDPYSNGTINWTHQIQNGTQALYYDDWTDISNLFSKKTYNGLTYYVIENVSFSKGQTRMLKIELMANPNTDGKFGLWLKRSSDSWSDVLANISPSIYLDPWWNSSFNLRFNLTLNCNSSTTTPNCDDKIATPWFFNNATIINKMGVGGASIRYVTECGSGNFTQRPIWLQTWNAGVNFSAWLNYSNTTTPSCTHWIYYNNSGASSVSSPWQIWDKYDPIDGVATNTTIFTCYTSCPYLGGNGWAEFMYVGARYGWYLAANSPAPVTAYAEIMQRSTVGKNIFVGYNNGAGNGYYSYYIKTSLSSDASKYQPRTTATQSAQALTTTLDQDYLYRMTWTPLKFNISRMSTATDSLSGAGFTYIHEQMTANSNSSGDIFLPYTSGETSNNASMFWVGITAGDDTPTITGYSPEESISGVFSQNVTLCNGTTCSVLGTLYKGNPSALNASGNCSSISISPLRGYFQFDVNGTAFKNTTTYNWIGNQTNYTNASVSGAAINKSDTWSVGLICYDETSNSTETMSQAFTVNNTAPTITAPSITANTYDYLNTSVFTCTNGTYSDYESDPQNATGWYRWFLNGTVLPGQTAQTILASNATIKANATDRIICEWQAQDTGYSRFNASNGPQNSSQVTINSAPVMNSVSWCEGAGCTAISSTYANTILNCQANATNDNVTLAFIRFMIYQNLAYTSNKTVYGASNASMTLMSSNSTITGFSKGTNLICGAYANDIGFNSTQLNASIILTINNTAPVTGTPWITSNESSNTTFYNTSIVTCNFGNYSDSVDGDANGSAYYRWWKNGAEYVGTTTASINFLSSGNTTNGDIWNCSLKQIDSGYDAKNSTERFSAGITIGSIGTPSITNCSSGFNVLNFTLWDEETSASMNGTMEITISLYNDSLEFISNSSFIYYNQHTFQLCINPYAASVYIDTFQAYYSNFSLSQYPQRNYFLLKAKLNASAPQVIPIYLENSTFTKQTTIYVQDETSRGISGVYIAIQRFYPGTNTYTLIAMSKTNTEGYGTAYLRPVDVYYRFVLYDVNGNSLASFTPAFVPCDPGDTACRTYLQIKPATTGYYWQVANGIIHNCTYTNSTGVPMVVCTFMDTTGLTKNASLILSRISGSSMAIICENTTTSTMATLICYVPSTPGTYGWRFTVGINPTLALETGEYTFGQIVTFGVFGLFIAGLFIMTLSLLGAMFGSPPLAIAFGTIGFLASWVMNLIVVAPQTVIGVVVIAGIMIFLTRRT